MNFLQTLSRRGAPLISVPSMVRRRFLSESLNKKVHAVVVEGSLRKDPSQLYYVLQRTYTGFFFLLSQRDSQRNYKLMMVVTATLGFGFWKLLKSDYSLAEEKKGQRIGDIDAQNSSVVIINGFVTVSNPNVKELSPIPRPDGNFVKRVDKEEEISKALKEGKICYLKGSGGFGKTQLALHYAAEKKGLYSHIIFLNCEDLISLQDSIKSVLQTCATNDPKQNVQLILSLIKSANPYWETTDAEGEKKKILIVIDNIDTKSVYDKIKPILDENIAGYVIATGRYEIPFADHTRDNEQRLEIVNVGSVKYSEAKDIFRNSLTTSSGLVTCKQFFESDHDRETEKFLMKTLQGIPLVIQLVAAHIKSSKKRNTNEAMKLFDVNAGLGLDDNSIATMSGNAVSYQKSIYSACIPHLEAISQGFAEESVKQIFKDFVYFIAFMAPHQNIPLKINKKLIDVLEKNSPNSVCYQYTDSEKISFLNRSLSDLAEHSLIQLETLEEEENTYLISLPLTVKISIMLNFLKPYETERQKIRAEVEKQEKGLKIWPSKLRDKKYYAFDKKRYLWFRAGIEYLTEVKSRDLFSYGYIIDFIHGNVESETLQVEIYNSLTPFFQDFISEIGHITTSSDFIARVDEEQLSTLRKIIEGAEKVGVKNDQLAKAHQKLSRSLLLLGKVDESERHKNIANILDSKIFSSFAKKYQKVILNFLRAEGTFTFNDGIITHVMSDRGAYFGTLINKNTTVTSLKLIGCHLNDWAIRKIAQSLAENKTLKSLHLEYNSEVTDTGVLCLARALTNNMTLEEISLSRCKAITDESVLELISTARPGFKLILQECSSIKNMDRVRKEAAERGIVIISS